MQAGTWYEIPHKAKSKAFATPKQKIVDLVKMSILAHRCGRGNIVWACWQPGGAGSEIRNIKRVNSGTMLVMLNRVGANTLSQQMDIDSASTPQGPMAPRHFDLALKDFLSNPQVNSAAKACYIFPPVGNYTTHVSGCDKYFSTGAGRPSCWRESWTCPGTRVEEDPQQRDKFFMAWEGSSRQTQVGSAVVDTSRCGDIEWLSFWNGPGLPPHYRLEKDRRPQKMAERLAKDHIPGVEPSATSSGTKGKGKSKYEPFTTRTTQGVVTLQAWRKGKGKTVPVSLRPNRPGPDQPALDTNTEEQWEDRNEEHTETSAPKATKRERRNIRGAILYRAMRRWVDTPDQALMCRTNSRRAASGKHQHTNN